VPGDAPGVRWVLLAAGVLFLAGLGDRPLYAPDEGRYAAIGRAMLESGDWVVPRLDGIPFLGKPPLLFWLEAAGMALLGTNEWGARLLPALVAWLGIALAMQLGREMFDRTTGMIAGAVLATSPLYLGVGWIVVTDGLLAVSVLGAFVCFWRALHGRSGALAGWLSLALAMLAKGPVGPLLFAAAAVPFWALLRPRPPLRRLRPLAGLLLFTAIALPWYLLVEWAVPGFSRYFFLDQNLKALVSPEVHHPKPWHFSLLSLAWGLLPWSAVLPFVGGRILRSLDRATVLLALWAAAPIVLFTLSVSKLPTYYVPALPPLALLVARGLRLPGDGRAVALVMSGLAMLAAATMGFVIVWPEAGGGPSGQALALASLATGAFAAGLLFRAQRPAGAGLAHAGGLLLAILVATISPEPFHARHSPRALLLRNRAELARCAQLVSLRFPSGMAEFYLDRPVAHVKLPKALVAPSQLVAGEPAGLGPSGLDACLAGQGCCVLTLTDKVDWLRGRRENLEILADDGKHAIVVPGPAPRVARDRSADARARGLRRPPVAGELRPPGAAHGRGG
jgi:4-amino-4-deoxy-L-arabinose transferase-like glycosyltransferase